MTEERAIAPIIIKRKKIVASSGHHGGAWKVAYADFVTAMMAFFMLMWLLNATTESQRKGIADYFNPTIPVNRISGGGEGMFGGESVFSEDALPQNGTGGSKKKPSAERQAKGSSGVDTIEIARKKAAEDRNLKEIKEIFEGRGGESSIADALLEHIRTRVTDEGLIVEIFDLPDEPLFLNDGIVPSKTLDELTAMLARVFSITTNQIAINGYTRAYPVVLLAEPAWDLSTNRAHFTRKMIEAKGMAKSRFERVSGWSDRVPVAKDHMAARNNRLEIILLRKDR